MSLHMRSRLIAYKNVVGQTVTIIILVLYLHDELLAVEISNCPEPGLGCWR